MHIFNIYNILFACLIGIVFSSGVGEVQLDPINNYNSRNLKKSKLLPKQKRYTLDIYSFGNTCVIDYENICETTDYNILVKDGISGHSVKIMLVQKEKSDIISVHTLMGKFNKHRAVFFSFKNIPSLNYNIIIEVSDLIYNQDYDIGKGCHCRSCDDFTREISLNNMENNIIHKTKSDKKNRLTYPQKSFVNGQNLFNKFLFFHSEISSSTIENYQTLYENYHELVSPCSGVIMTHSEKYNIHYDITSSNVHCYHVYLVDKFMNKLSMNKKVGDENIKFKNAIMISFEQKDSDQLIQIINNQNINLPLMYDNSYYISRGTVRGSLIKINIHRILSKAKYIYKNNMYNRMEYVHMFRILFQLYAQYNNISNEKMLYYTTGLYLPDGSADMNQLHNGIYALELAVLLNSLNFEFNVETIGLNNNVVIKKEKDFISEYGTNVYAQIVNNQLILRESSTEICLIILESIAREFSIYINNKLKSSLKNKCYIMRIANSYSNISTMYYTYELDCNMTLYYQEFHLSDDIMIKQHITNKTLFDEVSIELVYNEIFVYSVYVHAHLDKKNVDTLKKFVPKYVNNNSVISIVVVGRKSDRTETFVDFELKKISFSINCIENCTNTEPIVIEDNYDYIAISKICIENNNGLSTICFPEYTFSYIFDTRLLRVHTLSINPYPEIVLTDETHTEITESYYCVLIPYVPIIPNIFLPINYNDKVCKEYINRCLLITSKVLINNTEVPNVIKDLHGNFKLSFLTNFNERHEEMLQVEYTSNLSSHKEEHILTHYSNSLYTNMHNNMMHSSREKIIFNSSVRNASHNLVDGGDGDDDDDNFYNYESLLELKEYNIKIYNELIYNNELNIHVQTSKNDDISLYPFGQINVNYNKIKKNVYMKFMNDYIYFYDEKEEGVYNESISVIPSVPSMSSNQNPFVNVSPYTYECLGAYAYLMNKFNILVNGSLNCEAINMIIEVLLKGKMGKYFIGNNKNKIYLNFYKRDKGSLDVFDLVEMRIYESHGIPLKPIKVYKLNVSIDEYNQNLLYAHKNLKYPNKYYSNVYILMFKVAYLFNNYDFYTFFYDLTGIRLIDSNVISNIGQLPKQDKENIETVHELLKEKFGISIDRHTTSFEELLNEISLLAAYIVELTSSYKLSSQYINNNSSTTSTNDNYNYTTPFAEIKYFVYVDEFKYNNKQHDINQMMYHMSQLDVLLIKKKILCCSNFVDEVENALKYFILYKYISNDSEVYIPSDNRNMITKANNIIQKLLERPIESIDICEYGEDEILDIIQLIMSKSGYISKMIPSEHPHMECINLDMIDHNENVISNFFTAADSNGILVTITMNRTLLDNIIKIQEESDNSMDYMVYFLYRNLSYPFVGKSNKKETLEMKRFLLVHAGEPVNYRKSEIIFNTYLDILNNNSIFMLEKIIFVSKKGDKVVKELNVEYQTFFVHPFNLLLLIDTEDPNNERIRTFETYYNKRLTCNHYNNGLQVCDNYPEFSYNVHYSPFYVSYLENNQRKDILFTKNEVLSHVVNNYASIISNRYNIKLGGKVMHPDIYNTVQMIVHEVATSVGTYSLNTCGTLYLNNNQLHLMNDKNSLISNIWYDNYYCINRGAIFKEIIEICHFKKDDLANLFGDLQSNILPYTLNKQFFDTLTRDELKTLIYYFVSIPPQVISALKESSIYLEINELKDGNKNNNMIIIKDNMIYINREMLNNVENMKESLVLFNTKLYTNIIKYIPTSKDELLIRELWDVQHYMEDYIYNNDGCNNSFFTNRGYLELPHNILTYHYPSFTYTDNEEIYIKKKPDSHFSFNNVFLYEGQNYMKEKYLSAILVLSPYNFSSVEEVSYIRIIGNSLDNKNQLILNCYPRKNYDNSFVKDFNLEPYSIYFVCKNVFVQYLKNGLYEFNNYFIQYEKDGEITRQILEPMPVRPVYEVKNNNILLPIDEDKISIQVKNINKEDTKNDSIVKYLIYVCSDSIKLHEDPYMVVKPIFTLKSYLYNMSTHIIDDYMSYKYPRKLKHLEYINIPFSRSIFKSNTIDLSLVHNKLEEDNKVCTVYGLEFIKSYELIRVIIRDIFNNEFVVCLVDESVVPGDKNNTNGNNNNNDNSNNSSSNNSSSDNALSEKEKEPEIVVKPISGDKKEKWNPFLLIIECADPSKENLPKEKFYFVVFTKCVIHEGQMSLRVIGTEYMIDRNVDVLLTRNIFDVIYKNILKKVTLINGDYYVNILENVDIMDNIRSINPEKNMHVVRVDKNGMDYNENKKKIIKMDARKRDFNIDLNIEKIRKNTHILDIPKVLSIIDKNENIQKNEQKVVIPQISYVRKVDCLINISQLPQNSSTSGELFRNSYILLTNNLSSSICNVQVVHGKFVGTCIEGECILEESFLKRMIEEGSHLIDKNTIKDGLYELKIEKRIHLDKEIKSYENFIINGLTDIISSDSLKPSNTLLPPTSYVCIIENITAGDKIGLSQFKKIIEFESVNKIKNGRYKIHMINGEYIIQPIRNSAAQENDEILKKCINKAWSIPKKEHTGGMYYIKVMDRKKYDEKEKRKDDILYNKTDKDEKGYYLSVNRSLQGNIPNPIDNKIIHFVSNKNLYNSTHSIIIIDGKVYKPLGGGGVASSVYNVDLFKEDEEKFFSDLIKLLYAKPQNGLYYVQISKEKIDDMINYGIHDIITIRDNSFFEELDKENATNNVGYRMLITNTHLENVGTNKVNEMVIVHNYFMKPGVYYITVKDGKYIMDDFSSEDKTDLKETGIEDIIKLSGTNLKDDVYEIVIERVYAMLEGKNICYKEIEKDEKGEKEENDENDVISPSVVEPKKQKTFFRSYVYLLDNGNGETCSFKKIIEGSLDDIKNGRYSVQVLNGFYYPSIISGPQIKNDYIKTIIDNAWFLDDNRELRYYVDVHTYPEIIHISTADEIIGEEYYYIVLKYLDGEQDESFEKSQKIKIVAHNLQIGEYEIEVIDDNNFIGKDIYGNEMEPMLVKNIILLSYSKVKKGKYQITIMKHIVKIKSKNDDYNINNKNWLGTSLSKDNSRSNNIILPYAEQTLPLNTINYPRINANSIITEYRAKKSSNRIVEMTHCSSTNKQNCRNLLRSRRLLV
ncbi:oocyst capsule protein [Plasmodium sp. gorilla clade G2]|uniref:oocyst capsule protein n=1 Tax=Plasmodium sp. gorilla clade G2 TaxID=880535 RepID=UPI000D20E8D1|nr:oocyst capsule protein [Plasmodium sp. gorilla clade G2]SOV11014.1 oocyst capsule protein [Plasmodium sp. gorilla clade G2]